MLDLVFCQCSLLWIAPIQPTILEIKRVLVPGGDLVAIEPDYEALIEWPPEIATQNLWLSGLKRAKADPAIGRKLPVYLTNAGLEVNTYLLDQLTPPSELRFEFLKDLPLTHAENKQLHEIMNISANLGPAQQTVHLPFFLIIATKK
jgi:SAM-dependent methyltransferase